MTSLINYLPTGRYLNYWILTFTSMMGGWIPDNRFAVSGITKGRDVVFYLRQPRKDV
jgi:hypothetical protein